MAAAGGQTPAAHGRGMGRAALAALLLLAPACATAPAPVPRGKLPEPPSAWTAPAVTVADPAARVGGWLDDFDAPGLAPLVRAALDANPDLGAVAARLEAARAQARVAGAPRWPQARAELTAARTKRAPTGLSTSSARSAPTSSPWW